MVIFHSYVGLPEGNALWDFLLMRRRQKGLDSAHIFSDVDEIVMMIMMNQYTCRSVMMIIVN